KKGEVVVVFRRRKEGKRQSKEEGGGGCIFRFQICFIEEGSGTEAEEERETEGGQGRQWSGVVSVGGAGVMFVGGVGQAKGEGRLSEGEDKGGGGAPVRLEVVVWYGAG
ncbi:hypothetical protein KSS87_011434, partial [Heliosperma pusillum]